MKKKEWKSGGGVGCVSKLGMAGMGERWLRVGDAVLLVAIHGPA